MIAPATDAYDRKRRMAYLFAALSALLLFVNLSVGFFLEVYRRPLIAVDGETLHVAYRSQAVDAEAEPGTRLASFDVDGRPASAPFAVAGESGALLAEGADLSLFLGTRVSTIRDGHSVRSADLGQDWEVRAAALDPARNLAWIFGAREGRIVARRRALGAWSETLDVAPSGAVEHLTASARADGPFVAWREVGASKVRCVRYDGRAFVPAAEFDGVLADHWDALPWRDRVLLVSYLKEERTWRQVVLGLECCPGCPGPRVSARLAFADPVLVLGRRVTGLAAALHGERLALVLSRWTTVQAAWASPGGWTPVPAPGRLAPVGGEALWRILIAAAMPVLLLFFSFSMIFLGVTLLQQRGAQAVLETIRPVDASGPLPAEVLQRAMAYILDHILLLPPFIVLVEFLSVSPEVSSLDAADPKLLGMIGVWLALHFAYHFLLEWALGWTPGKRILGLRVAALDGSPVGFRGALLRNLSRILDAEYPLAVFLGGFLLMTSARRQRLGDRWGRTLVVQDAPVSRPSPRTRGV
jgi:uncharacterized RDD family membrane protein YckC